MNSSLNQCPKILGDLLVLMGELADVKCKIFGKYLHELPNVYVDKNDGQ